MLTQVFIFVTALFMVVRGATVTTKYAGRLAGDLNLSKYITGVMIIAVISILPEALIAINAAIKGIPEFGLGMLFGSNIADLTLIFALIILLTGRGLKIESQILKNGYLYPLLLFLPIVLGLDGNFTRFEGAALIIAGIAFYYSALKNATAEPMAKRHSTDKIKNIVILMLSMAVVLIGAHFTVTSASALAIYFNISPILIGMLVVGLGTTMPELFFSLKSSKNHDDSMAVGDILGIVLADATIVVGLLAVISPFSFPIRIIYVTGLFMVAAAILLFYFMRSGRTLSHREARFLLIFWLIFVLVEFIASSGL